MMKQASNGQLCDSMSMVEIALGDSLAVELAALTRATLVQIQVPQPYFKLKKPYYKSVNAK